MNFKKCLISFFILLTTLFYSFSQDYQLLENGKQAFPKIIECIQNSQSSIVINMFIWRDDKIGNLIAQECLNAADRGVEITISKDSYGSVCEHAEESGTSFFHKKAGVSEKIKINTLKSLYKNPIEKGAQDNESELYKKIINHPNIHVQSQVFKADHSKFYIFDNKILILGGINIEDKENGADLSGRVYNDYMLLLNGENYVQLFNQFRLAQENNIYFGVNRKTKEGKRNKSKDLFQMEQLYLDIINTSREELTIVMAYFSPLKNFIDAIVKASQRGVKVEIIMPASANFQDSSNKATVKKLLKKSDGKIHIYFSPKMLHTKLVANEKLISFGSCNITKKAFNQLDELNVFIKAQEAELYKQLMQSIEKTILEADSVEIKEIKYNGFLAFLEGFLV